jgi:anti-sigma factor RsiW
MSECTKFAPMLGSRDHELAPEEAAALTAHLAQCARCNALAADFAATDGMVRESLLARANARDFSTFADGVMARVGRAERPGLLGWLGRHRAAAAAALVPVVAALTVLMYVRISGQEPIAMLELSAEGEATTVLQTADGPVVLLQDEDSGS